MSPLRRIAARSCMIAALCACALAAGAKLSAPPAERPLGTAPLSASMPDDCIQFFKDKNYSGTMFQVSEVTGKPPWTDHELSDKRENKITSIRWSLPRGVVVSLHERDDGLGRMMLIFGRGETDTLSRWKMNDKLSGWTWNFLGGTNSPPKRLGDALAPRPKYAKACEPIPADSIHLFKNRECRGKFTAIERVTAQPSATFADMPGEIKRGTSSMRWKLPEGVIVIFSEGKDAQGHQLAIWGEGQFDSFAHWSMNDKLTQWAWYSVGEGER